MILKWKLLLLLFAIITSTAVQAQIEVVKLTTKGFSATGFGAFLNFSFTVAEGAAVSAEAGFYNLKQDDNHVALVPFLLGYRYQLNGTPSGLYIEPTAGYAIGGSDIKKRNEEGAILYENGSEVDQAVKGITAGIGTGYIFGGKVPINIGLRYQHVFVAKDPTLNLFSLRVSYPLSFGRREE